MEIHCADGERIGILCGRKTDGDILCGWRTDWNIVRIENGLEYREGGLIGMTIFEKG